MLQEDGHFWFNNQLLVKRTVVRQMADGDLQRFEQLHDMFMTGEQEHLVALLGESAQDGGGGPGTVPIEVDQYIVQHQGEFNTASGEVGYQGQAQAQNTASRVPQLSTSKGSDSPLAISTRSDISVNGVQMRTY